MKGIIVLLRRKENYGDDLTMWLIYKITQLRFSHFCYWKILSSPDKRDRLLINVILIEMKFIELYN